MVRYRLRKASYCFSDSDFFFEFRDLVTVFEQQFVHALGPDMVMGLDDVGEFAQEIVEGQACPVRLAVIAGLKDGRRERRPRPDRHGEIGKPLAALPDRSAIEDRRGAQILVETDRA